MGIGSQSDCLLGQSERTFRSSVSEEEVKKEKSGGVSGGEAGLGRTLRVTGQRKRKFRYLSVKIRRSSQRVTYLDLE